MVYTTFEVGIRGWPGFPARREVRTIGVLAYSPPVVRYDLEEMVPRQDGAGAVATASRLRSAVLSGAARVALYV